MRLSEGVEWGLHCCVLLAFLPDGAALPAGRLAEYHGVPTAYLAKHMQALSRTGLVDAAAGPRGGYRLARSPGDISMLDVVEAIDGAQPAFECHEIRRRGPTGVPGREYHAPCAIHAVMDRAHAAWRAELASTSVADLVAMLAQSAPPKAIEKGIKWFQEVLA